MKFLNSPASVLLIAWLSVSVAYANEPDEFLKKVGLSELSTAKLYRALLNPSCQVAHKKHQALDSEFFNKLATPSIQGRSFEVIHKDVHKALVALAACLKANGSDYPPPLSAYRPTSTVPLDHSVGFNINVFVGYRKLLEKRYANIGDLDNYIAALELKSEFRSKPTSPRTRTNSGVPDFVNTDSQQQGNPSKGIQIESDISIDDIPKLERSTARSTSRKPRTCSCPAGTFEYFGYECRSIESREPITTALGGYPFHKGCDATYADPERISEY